MTLDEQQEEQLLDVVRDTVVQLERLTKRLQSFIDKSEETSRG